MSTIKFDLLTTVEQGGCSAKIGAAALQDILSKIKLPLNDLIEVDISSGDDAGVYRLNDTTSLIVTTDFFPPICSDATEFGQIAATNSISDVYAMGGKPLLVLNINMFPADSIPIEVLGDILLGGQSVIDAAGAFTMGGHTIHDATVKYGLAVVGTVTPERLITNARAQKGDMLILTKPLGAGIVVAGQRTGLAAHKTYRTAIDNMKILNDTAAEIMQKYSLHAATDITGFGLAGHLLSLVKASGVSAEVDCKNLPIIDGAIQIAAQGCIPGAAFRNLDHVKHSGVVFESSVDLEHKAVVCDAQTSGGILMCAPQNVANDILAELRSHQKCAASAIIGQIMADNANGGAPIVFR